MKLFDPHLLNLFPYHRQQEKRTQMLTLDELIDDYRKAQILSGSDFDFLMMSYRYEHLFQSFFKTFLKGKLKPPAMIDLLRLSFSSLLTRDAQNTAQLTHALVESSKKIFGPHTSTLCNAFCRKLLREKDQILIQIQQNPEVFLGESLLTRWKKQPELIKRFAQKVSTRPNPGISVLKKNKSFDIISLKEFKEGETLALSQGSYDLIKWIAESVKASLENKNLTFLDMCAAPGGKLIGLLTFLQSLDKQNKNSFNYEKIAAVDSKFKRVERLKGNLKSWQLLDQTQNFIHDWTQDSIPEELDPPKKWNLIIADLPCTGLGTLASRPDILLENWSPASDKELFEIQEKIIKQALRVKAKEGIAFVSICSSDPSEIKNLSQVIGAEPTFQSLLSETNNEEITAWRIQDS